MKKYTVFLNLSVEGVREIQVDADEMVISDQGGLNFYVESNKEGHDKYLKASFSPGYLVAVIRQD